MEFFNDVGDVRWRRVSATLAITAPTRQYDLPDAFGSMIDIKVPPAGVASLCDKDSLPYIGEDSKFGAPGGIHQTGRNAAPLSYYIVPANQRGHFQGRLSSRRRTDAGVHRRTSCISRARYLPITQSSVDMGQWVPEMLQARAHQGGSGKRILLDRGGSRRPALRCGSTPNIRRVGSSAPGIAAIWPPRNFSVFVN